MAKRITKLSKFSKSEIKKIMNKLYDGELRPMDIKSPDGTSKHAVLYNIDGEELLIILDNIAAKAYIEDDDDDDNDRGGDYGDGFDVGDTDSDDDDDEEDDSESKDKDRDSEED